MLNDKRVQRAKRKKMVYTKRGCYNREEKHEYLYREEWRYAVGKGTAAEVKNNLFCF